MPDVTQLSHGRSSLLGTPMFRDTLCSAFLSVNTNFCSSSLLHLDGAVPPRYSGSGGETDFDGHPVVAVAAVAPCLASNLPLLGLSPCSSFGEASLSPCAERGSAALPASSQHRHVVVTWSFEVTVFGSVQAPELLSQEAPLLRFFSGTFGRKNFLFLKALLIW